MHTRDPDRVRAELLIQRPSTVRAMGRVREAVNDLRAEASAELMVAETRLGEVVMRRRELIERIGACDRALAGTGIAGDGPGASRMWWPRALPEPGERVDDSACVELRGSTLRRALVDVLRAADAPMSINDLHRVLAAHECRPPGRASHAISNALAIELRSGRVRRVRRGWYTAP